MRERTQMRGPKCGPKLDPNVWTQFSPIGIRTDGLQPNLGPQGIVARFRTTFGSTFGSTFLGPRVRVHSTRLAPHIQCQREELNQKKTNKNNFHLGANWGANIRSRGWGVLRSSRRSGGGRELGRKSQSFRPQGRLQRLSECKSSTIGIEPFGQDLFRQWNHGSFTLIVGVQVINYRNRAFWTRPIPTVESW